MNTLYLASRSRRVLLRLFLIAIVTLVFPEARAAEPAPPQYQQNKSIEQNMINAGVSPFPTRTPAPNSKAAADIAKRKAELEELRRDSATLVELASSLKEDLAKANENVLSVYTMEKAEQIEKIAKKIKKWAKSN